MKREFIVKIPYETDCRTIEEGKMQILGIFKMIGFKELEIEVRKNLKSDAQTRALHLFYTLLADEFNEKGLDIKTVLSKNVEHPWTKDLVKELIWKKVQKSYVGKKSTTQLTTDEVDKIFNVINKFIGETWGIHIPFPSEDGKE